MTKPAEKMLERRQVSGSHVVFNSHDEATSKHLDQNGKDNNKLGL